MTRNSGTDDKKLQATLKKMNVQPIQAIEEVNMFKADGNVIHFSAPKGKHDIERHTSNGGEIVTKHFCRSARIRAVQHLRHLR